MTEFINLTGQKFGKLTVLGICTNLKNNSKMWVCECECGNYCVATCQNLKRGAVKSCGCLQKDLDKRKIKRKSERVYRIYLTMKKRCYSIKSEKYKNYGGRGITVCDEWLNDYQKFERWALQNGYAENLTLERIDVNGNYEPNNCKWATMKEQQNNRTNNRLLTLKNKCQNISQWAEELNIKVGTLYNRLKLGWTIEEALTTPIGQKRKKKE